MPKITFVEPSGESVVVDAEAGSSIMQTAQNNGINGILGDCGGACSCATCHCYIPESHSDRFPPPGEVELAMLEMAIDLRESSRLSCQLEVTDALDGLVVTLPQSQF